MKKTLVWMIIGLLAFSAGCGSSDAEPAENAAAVETLEVDRGDEETSAVEPSRVSVRTEAEEGFDETAWDAYANALSLMNGLDAREEQFLVYTHESEGDQKRADSVDVRLKRLGLTTGNPQFSAVGVVVIEESKIPLELYYQDGILYSVSGNAKVKAPSTYEDAVVTVDILGGFYNELKKEYILSISRTDNADGTVFLDLSFHGNINGVDTNGTGEIILNAEGYMVSQDYHLIANVEQDGEPMTVEQNVECTLLSYGDRTTPIDPVDPEAFIEAPTSANP